MSFRAKRPPAGGQEESFTLYRPTPPAVSSRQKGIGTSFLRASLPWFFENLELQYLLCEPYAQNIAPNNTLSRLGFTYAKS